MLPKASSLAVIDVLFDKEEILYSICNAMEKKVKPRHNSQYCFLEEYSFKRYDTMPFSDQNEKFYGNYSQEFHR
jgi:BirA family biotin operon repressor/biotin-[acetyl-CoA-carboxylase] ligase